MQERSKALQQAFLLITCQYSILFFVGELKASALLFIFIALITSLSLLLFRLGNDKKEDYFPNLEVLKKEDQGIKVLILGKEVEPESHENEKDERYFRVAEQSSLNKLSIQVLCYFLIIFSLFYFFTKSMPQPPLRLFLDLNLSPVIFVGISLLTRSHGQLLYLPTYSFLFVFFKINWNQSALSHNFIIIFALLFVTLSAFKLIDSLRVKSPLSFMRNPLAAIPFTALTALIFVVLLTLLPIKTSIQKSPARKKSNIQKMNRTLGKLKQDRTDEKLVRNLESLKKNIDSLKMKPKTMEKMFNQAEKQIDKMGDFLKNIPNLDFELPKSEFNQLSNDQRSLKRELKDLKGQIFKQEEVDPEMLKKVLGLMKKIDANAKKLQHLAERGGTLQSNKSESLNSNLEGYFTENLKEGISQDIQEEISFLNEKSIQEKTQKILQEKGETAEENPHLLYEGKKQEALKKINKKLEKEKKKRDLLPPKLLENILDILKYALLGLVFFLIYQALKKYFFKNDVQEGDQGLSSEEKRKLLLKRKYSSSSQEIRSLYLQYMEAIKKVYYGEEEPPPPKVLYPSLIEQYPRRKKLLGYFLEVFSLSEYRSQEMPRKVMIKYRKAYRRLIKDL
ncbi:MAG: hypothetical protein NXH75_06000 [Halobacteriovoraceae bacterium]|nr:hypothetical protein [Halobacteriovoraceae bacterium]